MSSNLYGAMSSERAGAGGRESERASTSRKNRNFSALLPARLPMPKLEDGSFIFQYKGPMQYSPSCTTCCSLANGLTTVCTAALTFQICKVWPAVVQYAPCLSSI